MIRTVLPLALATSLWLTTTLAFAQPVIDGSWDAGYQILAVQDTQTGFGDSNLGMVDYANGSELDVAYGTVHNGWLYLLLAGNLESNFNKQVVDADITGIDISLTNGDIDGDNEVTLFDFGALVAAFGSVPGDSGWNPNADLDGDLEVTLFDFGVLVRNFGAIGAE